MENNTSFNELIVSYLSNNLNTEEQAFVLDWINASEQNKQYFKEVRKTWKLLSVKEAVSHIDVDNEWNEFIQVISEREINVHVNGQPAVMQDISTQSRKQGMLKIRWFIASTAIAVSLIFAMALLWKGEQKAKSVESLVGKAGAKKQLASPFVQYHYNTTNQVRHFVLQDQSEVNLFGKSSISFFKPFLSNTRDITLLGKAMFIISENSARPFTVYSGNISTTALGTQFSVTAFEKEKNVIVRLYDGKVVVKTKSHSTGTPADYFLTPGEELVYNNKTFRATIRKFKLLNSPVEKKRIVHPVENPTVPKFAKGTWYMFNNQPLDQVFHQLETMFHVTIMYTRKDVANIYLVGTFNISDSLEVTLREISTLNNLKVTKKNNKFIISK